MSESRDDVLVGGVWLSVVGVNIVVVEALLLGAYHPSESLVCLFRYWCASVPLFPKSESYVCFCVPVDSFELAVIRVLPVSYAIRSTLITRWTRLRSRPEFDDRWF